MTQDTTETAVIFRRDRRAPRGVFAIFPFEPSDRTGHHCTVFDPLGGHGGGDPRACVAMSTPADPDTEPDAAAVRRQLGRGYGYKLRVIRRVPSDAFAKRRAAINH